MSFAGHSDSGYAYRPALDGVRAVAVAAVLLFHGAAFLPGGFLGVDAFFVLSGFLITSLLLAERDRHGRIRLTAFWGRRARRLLPALLVLLLVTVVGAHYLLPADNPMRLRWDALSALSYVANWRMIYQGGGYFDQTAPASALQHTWSLGIEEQFYLLWPLLLLVIPRRFLALSCCAGALLSAGVMALLYDPFDADRAYFGTDTRAQALLIGGVFAARALSRWVPAAAATLGAPLFLFALVRADGSDAWLYRGGFLLVALAVAGVIAYAVTSPRGLIARFLALSALVWVGQISYGLYLWHWPLYQFLTAERTGMSGFNLLAFRLAVTIAVAYASYLLIEQPIRRRLVLPRRVLPAATATAMAGVTAVVVVMTPVPRVPTSPVVFSAPSAGASAAPAHTSPMRRPGRKPGKLPRVTFFGDSISWSLGTYWPRMPNLDVSVAAVQGCGIALLPEIMQLGTPHTNIAGCERWPGRWQAAVNKYDPDVAAILLDRWELMDRKLNGRWTHVGEPDYNAYLTKQLRLGIEKAGARGARVVLLTAPYTHRVERPDGGLYPEDQPSRVDAWNALLRKVAGGMRQQPVIIDLNKRVCPDGKFTWSVKGLRIRSDGLHFTGAGVRRYIAPWLAPQFSALAS
jgi:peptidoglycan/LPS O-acetylase OafA/YrhL